MKISVFTIATILSITFLFSCKNKDSHERGKKENVILTAIDLDQRLKGVDSLVVVFYKDPYSEDSLRYTRYYSQTSVTSLKEIDILQKELVQSFAAQEKRRNCRGEGKIWCFTKGKIFQTLYFSTRCDDCCYTYLIKDGIFYYSRISDGMIAWLKDLKTLSKEPGNGGDGE